MVLEIQSSKLVAVIKIHENLSNLEESRRRQKLREDRRLISEKKKLQGKKAEELRDSNGAEKTERMYMYLYLYLIYLYIYLCITTTITTIKTTTKTKTTPN